MTSDLRSPATQAAPESPRSGRSRPSEPKLHWTEKVLLRRLRGEKGYVLVLAALIMVPLLAFTGFAVDVGSWYARANRLQRAADAGALAGVVWMPDDDRARTVAIETVGRNGVDTSDPDIDITVEPVGSQRLRVTIHDQDVPVYFSSVFLSNVDIARTAVGEYVRSIPMGSPDNTLANDPERWNVSGYSRPFYWLNTAGRATNKENGDRHTAGADTNGNCHFGCTAGVNDELSEEGYFFRVEVDSVQAQPLRVQIYDPAFFYTGDVCDANTNLLDSTSGSFATQVATLTAQGHPDAATRYVRGNTQWCPGDQSLNGANVRTTYMVREPDQTPFDSLDNPIICAVTFDAYNEAVYPLLNQADGYRDGNIGSEQMPFDDHFRQWTDVCTDNSPEVGDYLVQITTTASQTGAVADRVGDTPITPGQANHDPAINTGGHNRYAMRTGFGTPGTLTFDDGLGTFADGRLPIYVNQSVTGSTTNFFLARVTPEYAAQVLELEFWDMADGANSDFTIIPPPDQTGSALGDCRFIRQDPPEVDPTEWVAGTCSLVGVASARYNGRLVTVQIPIPEDYSCNASSSLGCWFKVDIDFNGGTPTATPPPGPPRSSATPCAWSSSATSPRSSSNSVRSAG